ncbi:hypothetical protein PIROE2DRAFT_10324 [Piromyces sp. E2]|nr:hypothetical protein PIROE2DRAFT_10324 [Piromyces sp. E2]|eukprot:OUM63167.1 hypothetical protein PIROE2DRAFT_10324 [Piromyces sp. E2]
MNRKKFFQLLILSLINAIIIKTCLAIDVNIPNEKYNIANISNLIKDYGEKYNVINIYITKDYVTSSEMAVQHIQIPENTNVTLIGNPNNDSGTTFDFTNNKYGSIDLNNFSIEKIDLQFKVENITFINFFTYSSQGKIHDSPILILGNEGSFNRNTEDYQILFDSCRFE